MTWFAQLLLVLTSLAPVCLVYAGVAFDQGHARHAMIAIAVAAALVALCALLLWGVRRKAPDTFKVSSTSDKEGEAVAFLVAYALPLAKGGGDTNVWGMVAFTLMMISLVWHRQMFHINPLLAAIGYHFFTGEADDGRRVLVLSPQKTMPSGDLAIVKLSEYLWLHCP
jgi:hypothetical protein